MSTMNEKNRELFRAEAYDLLAELESSLLDLENSPDDKDLIGRIFRALHTIKGSGSMFGFDDIAAFTHKIETLFDRVRSGEVSVTKDLIDLTFSAVDHIRDVLGTSPRIPIWSSEEKRLYRGSKDFSLILFTKEWRDLFSR